MRLLLLLLCVCLSILSYGQVKLKTAVLKLDAGVGLTQSQVDGLQDIIISALDDTGLFSIVERSRVNDLVRELGIARGMRLTANQRRAFGRRLGVEAIAVGTVNYLVRERSPADMSTQMSKGEYNIDLRLVRVNDGVIIASSGDSQYSHETARKLIARIVKSLTTKLESNGLSSNEPRTPIILQDYLMVYPHDLGLFSTTPTQSIAKINKLADFGHNDWRLPTDEELSVMNNNRQITGMRSGKEYATKSSIFSANNPLTVRLVRTKVFARNDPNEEGIVSLSPKSYNFGKVGVLSSSATGKVKLINESTQTIQVIEISSPSSNLSASISTKTLFPGETAIITITLRTAGRQGLTLKHELEITYNNDYGDKTLFLPIRAQII